MPGFITRTLNPDWYHGHNRVPPFFEGWYFKLVSPGGDQRMAVIPGVFLGRDGHAFIQVLDGANHQSDYVRYPLSDFWAAPDDFHVRVGGSSFYSTGLSLDLESSLGEIKGKLRFDQARPWPVRLVSPGIMGWYAWVPRMECYHGVVSFDHAIDGMLTIGEQNIDFSGGRGYIEKDWGQAFPEGYIWFQSNHFEPQFPQSAQVCSLVVDPSGSPSQDGSSQAPVDQCGESPVMDYVPGISLTASVAIIPWVGRAFRGFIVGLWMDGELYRFATYTGARIEQLELGQDTIDWVIRDRRYRLSMHVRRVEGSIILGPTRQDMNMRVDESISASLEVRLETLQGRVIFEGVGSHVGLEVQGDIQRLLRM